MPCLLSLVKQGPRATLNREYFFSGLLYWHTYSEKMLLYVLQRWRTLNPKSRQRKIQKQFKETNFEIFSYAIVLHVCCITVFCLSDLKQVINCFDQLMQFTACPHITRVTNIPRTDCIKLRWSVAWIREPSCNWTIKHLGFNVSFIGEGPPSTWIQLQIKYILIALCTFRHRSWNCIWSSFENKCHCYIPRLSLN